jgi:hypothetical protein
MVEVDAVRPGLQYPLKAESAALPAATTAKVRPIASSPLLPLAPGLLQVGEFGRVTTDDYRP